jgi:hypothetical protein
MNVFFQTDYRKIFRLIIRKNKKLGEKITLTDIANEMRVQRPYLSKVLNYSADLNSDQMFLACRFLKFSGEESHYMGLLLEHSRSSSQERKELLWKQITEIQNKNLEIKKHLKAPAVTTQDDRYSLYYLDPMVQIVHLFLTIPRYLAHPERIEEDLKISKKRFTSILKILDELKIIDVQGDSLKVLVQQMHLPKGSPPFGPAQILFRLKSLDRIAEVGDAGYGFSVSFSADEKTRKATQQNFLEFLKKTEALVGQANPEHVYQINFDLLPWSSN